MAYTLNVEGAELDQAIDNALHGFIKFTGKTVPVSAWAADTSHTGYGFKATIGNLSGMTTSYSPFVIFDGDDATFGGLAPFSDSVTDGVCIYAVTKPTVALTIPVIMAWR